MKKILIIVGILLLIIVGVIGAYVVKNGVPENVDEVFGKFGNSGDAPVFTPEEEETESFEDWEGESANSGRAKRLRQLTTRPVAGAVFTNSTIRFVERGTGHIYEMDTRSGGVERIISGTTLPRTIRAVFSSSGEQVVLVSEEDGELVSILGTLGNSNAGLEVTRLPEGAVEAGFARMSTTTLNFFVPNTRGGTAYAYSLIKGEATELFTIPLHDVRILWGTPTYLYTTPSYKINGYVYKIDTAGLEFVTNGNKGLMAIHHASGTVVSTVVDGKMRSRDTRTGDIPLLTMFTEKCAVVRITSKLLVCGSPIDTKNANLPDDWFKGIVGFSDRLLLVDSASSTVKVLSSLEEEAGRPIDILRIGTDSTGTRIYMINKYDGALWLLDLNI